MWGGGGYTYTRPKLFMPSSACIKSNSVLFEMFLNIISSGTFVIGFVFLINNTAAVAAADNIRSVLHGIQTWASHSTFIIYQRSKLVIIQIE